MNADEMNRAIAEALGWKRVNLGSQLKGDNEPRGWLPPSAKGNWRYAVHYCPGYATDLNACHEMEKAILCGNGWAENLRQYSDNLKRIVQDSNWPLWGSDAVNCRLFTVHATAPQRCEAFLRVKNLWKE